jgi:hypothetical protein
MKVAESADAPRGHIARASTLVAAAMSATASLAARRSPMTRSPEEETVEGVGVP